MKKLISYLQFPSETRILRPVQSLEKSAITSHATGLFALLWFSAVFIRLITALVNYGFHGLDDYYIVSTSIPAQVAPSFEWKIENSGIRSPLLGVFVHAMGQGALQLGLTDPLHQIQFLYAVLGFFSLLTVYAGQKLFELQGNTDRTLLALAVLGLYWVLPLISTRMLVETLATPFLLMSLLFLTRYDFFENKWSLVGSLAFLTMAAMVRFQVGVVLPALFLIPLIKKKYTDLIVLSAAGIVLFLASGIPDLLLRGEFHGSLRSYTAYNMEFSHCYGTQPFYQYIPIFLGLALLPPMVFSRFRKMDWFKAYRPLLAALLFFVLFFIAHSITPRKEERFIFTIIPVFLLLLLPMIEYIVFTEKGRIRIGAMVIINFALLTAATFSVAQQSTVRLVRFLSSHHEIKDLFIYDDSLEHFPISYGLRPPLGFHKHPSTEQMELLKSSDFAGETRDSGALLSGLSGGGAQGDVDPSCQSSEFQSGFIPTTMPDALKKKKEQDQKLAGNHIPSPVESPHLFEKRVEEMSASGCDSVFVVREDYLNRAAPVLSRYGLEEKRVFSPGFLEGILVDLTTSNRRRGAMHLYAPIDCSF